MVTACRTRPTCADTCSTTPGTIADCKADFDGDGLRKERDPDNDRKLNNGSKDGCEDGNHNGKLDAGETSNFNSADDGACTTPPPPAGDMVIVPAGTFRMGCDPAHNGGYSLLLR